MEDLLDRGERLLEVIDNAIKSGDWKFDGACDPTAAIESFKAELFFTYFRSITDSLTKSSEVLAEREECARLAEADELIATRIRARGVPLYTAPPKREWVGLTDEERRQIVLDDPFDWVAAVEAKLKEKNNG